MKTRKFTSEQVEFIRAGISEMSKRRLAEAFSKYFDEPIGQTEIRRVMKRNGIENPRKEYSTLPVGTERYSAYYDCIVVKVNNVSVARENKKNYAKLRGNNWKLKQNLVWEQATGQKLPKGHVIVFLDGDRLNYAPDNLYAVPLQVAGTVAKMRMASENPVIYKTALMWGELYFALKQHNKRNEQIGEYE